jgi:hypothetical protein
LSDIEEEEVGILEEEKEGEGVAIKLGESFFLADDIICNKLNKELVD